METPKFIYLIKTQKPSFNSLMSMKKGLYPGCNVKLSDENGAIIGRQSRKEKEMRRLFLIDLGKSIDKSNDERSVNNKEWHHLNGSSWAFTIDINKMIKLGYNIFGNPNKEFKLK